MRARKAVIIGTGGHLNNREIRTMFDPHIYMDVFEDALRPLLGPHGQDASGIIAGMDIGANLAGMMQNFEHQLASPRLGNVLATRDLHANIFPGHPIVRETVTRYNAFAVKGVDEGFEKPVMHRIDTPPFCAAWAPIGMLDSFGGLRINRKAQVVDRWGKVIPGLYAAGEASGEGQQHGLARASVHGYIAGTNAARES